MFDQEFKFLQYSTLEDVTAEKVENNNNYFSASLRYLYSGYFHFVQLNTPFVLHLRDILYCLTQHYLMPVVFFALQMKTAHAKQT